jgi:hypothetical protein
LFFYKFNSRHRVLINNYLLLPSAVFINATLSKEIFFVHDSKPTRHSTKNHILLALPEEDYQRLHPHLELVHLSMGEVINRPEEQIKYVYFPNGAMSSVIATTAGGQAVEVGVVGREGVSGIDVFLEVEKAAYECMIQLPDSALRIKTEIVKEEFKGGGRSKP